MSKKMMIIVLLVLIVAAGWAFGKYASPSTTADGNGSKAQVPLEAQPPAATAGPETASPAPSAEGQARAEMPEDPESITALINKEYGLPDHYRPDDLVYPDVRFLFKEKIEKRMMRKEAAEALEELFAAAEADGIRLAGVSAFRSAETQQRLFNLYVERDGEEKAKTYSAMPGYSEHQTGLAIDVSGSDGSCAAESCFAGTPEAEWLEQHAADFGYIIRFPEGKEDITGYMYEPWHIRYVGKEIARVVTEQGITLEEYYNAVPVSKPEQ